MDASAYIAEQIPLLQQLHAQLALAPTALAEDTARIDAAVRAAIVSVVRSREDEVAGWKARIADGKRALASLARAVGERGRSVVNANRRESEPSEPLPAQHERLVRQTDELEQVYKQRLAHIEQLHETIERLSILLGPPFEAPAPLMPIPGTAVPARAPRPSVPLGPPPTANNLTAPTINKRTSGRRASFLPAAPTPPEPKPETWLDVGEDVVNALQASVDAALAERDTRLRTLETIFNDLIWYRAELDITLADGLPSDLRPSKTGEEVPGDHARYEALLERVVSLNPRMGDEEEGQEIQGMEDVEPEVGLMAWAEELLQLWMDEKEARDAQIQDLFERIEPLWVRLEIEQEYIDQFTERNVGSGLASIQAYEQELERVLEIRKTSLSSFVIGVRKEIATLQDALLLSEDEKAEFGAFIDDEYTEELLSAHEAEAERLRAEVESAGVHLSRVKEWMALKADEEELERSAADPNRFKKRGTAMLQEERMRKRVEKRKPKVEAELLASLPEWEGEHGRPFLARGARVVDMIEDALAAKEAAKEAKKRAKMGLGPGAAPKLPGTRAAATPATGSRSQPGTLRKRDAPTPSVASTSKRPRIASGSSSRTVSGTSSRSVSGTSTRSASATGFVGGYISGPSIPNGSSTGSAARRHDPYTPTANAHARRFGAPAGARANTLASNGGGRAKVLVPHKAEDARAKDVFQTPGSVRRGGPRKSFKPRQSLASGLLSGRFPVDEMEEDDDVF